MCRFACWRITGRVGWFECSRIACGREHARSGGGRGGNGSRVVRGIIGWIVGWVERGVIDWSVGRRKGGDSGGWSVGGAEGRCG